jgi:hypothetical protein
MTRMMTSTVKSALVAGVLALGAPAASAEAAVPLNQEPHINQSLVAVAVGNAIRKTCPSISARMLVALSKGRELQAYAYDKGYSKDEVDAFLEDKAEKARVKALAADYMAANGVIKGDVDSYCALGKAEIRKDSLIGQLLKD